MSPAEGARELEIAISESIFEINQEASARANQGLRIMQNTAYEVLGQDGTGRSYGKHIASAPDEPPAPDTGSLRGDWQRQKLAAPNGMGKGIRITLRLKSKMEYAKYLDPGTRYIAKRPYVKPIEDKARPAVVALFAGI